MVAPRPDELKEGSKCNDRVKLSRLLVDGEVIVVRSGEEHKICRNC